MSQKKGPSQEKKLDLEIVGEPESGIPLFSNYMEVGHSVENFFLTMYYVQPSEKEPLNANILGRFGISPQHAKRLSNTLKKNVERYEKNFGKIKDIPERETIIEGFRPES